MNFDVERVVTQVMNYSKKNSVALAIQHMRLQSLRLFSVQRFIQIKVIHLHAANSKNMSRRKTKISDVVAIITFCISPGALQTLASNKANLN